MGRQILIADNDALIRKLLSEALAERGYEVRLAADGIEAWEQMQAARPDYLLLDLIMPELDGIRLCRYVKADPRFQATRVIILTAAAEAASSLGELGADGYLAKRSAPDMIQELLSVLARLEAGGREGAEDTARRFEMARPRQIVKELLAEREHLNAVLQNLGEGVLVLDFEGHVLFMNSAAEQLLGRQEQALLGKSLSAALGELIGTSIKRAQRELLSHGSRKIVRLQFPFQDRMLLLSLSGLVQDGHVHNYLLLVRDVTSYARRIDELTSLNELAGIFTSTLQLDELLQRVMERVQFLMQGEAGALLLIDPASGELVFQVAVGDHRELVEGLHLKPGQGIAGWVAREGVPIIVPDTGEDLRFYPGVDALTGFRTRSILCVPLRVSDNTIGVIQVLNEQRQRRFDVEDLNLLTAIAGQAAFAIENARLHAAARQHARQLTTLNALTRTITTTLDPSRLPQEIVTTIQALLPGVAVRLWGWGVEQAKVLQLIAADGLRNPEGGRQLRVRMGEGLIGHVAATRQLATIPDLRVDPRFINREWAASEGLVSSILLPLVFGDRLHGVLSISTRAPHVFSEVEQDLLGAFAAQAAIAMENARLFAELNDSYLRLQQAQDELIRAEKLRALGQMAAGIAHDLNNMLAALLSQAELLRLRATDPAMRQALAKLETTATGGAQVVRRLQDFARHRPTRPLAPCSVGQLVEEALELTRPRWKDEPQRRGVVIEVLAPPQEIPPILGHAAEVREALMNLILNAVDAMPQGGTLTIAARGVPTEEQRSGGAEEMSPLLPGPSAPQQFVELAVSDTGVGMTEDVRKRMFDPFFTTKGLAGTGLGLSVVYGIMERHGGLIHVTSAPDQGTRVRLWFRAAGSAPAQAAAPAPAAGLARRILVVEDDAGVREALVGLLQAVGHHVLEAEGGSTALAQFAPGQVDLIITDLGMPDMTGWDLARAIRAKDPAVPIILLTGWGEQMAGETEAAHLVNQIIGKPIRLEELQAAIAELTGC